ncbi:hypothetical protein DPEC_G00001920 [Dallia pectoralis]|uniref:Uncharacterized protein n=2 Tax=Dallia pectoralis TaxID=75939 RepID=A0ACC2HJX3_DALPE|nr:hypothetical protein DPEC_G00001920 [Dallia pectoralis]
MDCRACGKKGHIERACRNKKSSEKLSKTVKQKDTSQKKKYVYAVEQESTEVSDSSEEEVILKILTVAGGTQGYYVSPLLEGQPVRMEIDTGAAVSIVSESIYKKTLKHLTLKPGHIVLKTYTGESVAVRGITTVTVQLNGQTEKLPLYVVKGNYPSLLGRSWLEKINIDWPSVRTMKHGDTGLPALLEKHGEVFNGELGSMKNITVKLNIKPDSKPKLMKARPVPYVIRPKVEADLDALVNNKVLEPVTVSEWATPIVPVLKKDGGIRICGDFKGTLNPVLLVEQYPLPHIEDLFASLAGGQKFSKIDLCQAYLQMHVDEKSKKSY